jgi:hypothetical protein
LYSSSTTDTTFSQKPENLFTALFYLPSFFICLIWDQKQK